MKSRFQKAGNSINRAKARRTLTLNPFKSQAQRAACYAGAIDIDCREWESATPKRKLPKHVRNAAKARKLGRIDPTRTVTMRRAFAAKIRAAFAELKGRVVRLVLKDDALGLTTNCNPGQMRGADGKCGPGVGLGIKRDEMPQIPADSMGAFLAFAARQGVRVWSHFVDADSLSPTQAEFRQERVDAIPDEALDNPILIADGYILDGTHRWVKQWQRGPRTQVRVKELDLSVEKALDLMHQFEGVKYATNSSQETDWDRLNHLADLRMELAVWGGLTENAAPWTATTSKAVLDSFQAWLKTQYGDLLLGADEEELWDAYIQQGFLKGAGRAYDDVRSKAKPPLDVQDMGSWYRGSRDEFLRSSFAQPVAREKVQLLAARSFDELENVTADMSNRMSRVLTDGLVEGQSPRDVARTMAREVDIGADRALKIAHTELIRVHAEGQLIALKGLGVTKLGVQVEFSTADDELVCPECESMEGAIYDISDASGVIPVHVSCRCTWIPANVGEEKEDEDTTENRRWVDEGPPVWNRAPWYAWPERDPLGEWLATNAFCPTGPGGGIDPTCSPGQGGVSAVTVEEKGWHGAALSAKYSSPEERKEYRLGTQRLTYLNKMIKAGTGTADHHSEKERLSSRLNELRQSVMKRMKEGQPAPPTPEPNPAPEEKKEPPSPKLPKSPKRKFLTQKEIAKRDEVTHEEAAATLKQLVSVKASGKFDAPSKESQTATIHVAIEKAVSHFHPAALKKMLENVRTIRVTNLEDVRTEFGGSHDRVLAFYRHPYNDYTHFDSKGNPVKKGGDVVLSSPHDHVILAHELMHAVDANRKYSSTDEFRKAWKEDITAKSGQPRIRVYGHSDPVEGMTVAMETVAAKSGDAGLWHQPYGAGVAGLKKIAPNIAQYMIDKRIIKDE